MNGSWGGKPLSSGVTTGKLPKFQYITSHLCSCKQLQLLTQHEVGEEGHKNVINILIYKKEGRKRLGMMTHVCKERSCGFY